MSFLNEKYKAPKDFKQVCMQGLRHGRLEIDVEHALEALCLLEAPRKSKGMWRLEEGEEEVLVRIYVLAITITISLLMEVLFIRVSAMWRWEEEEEE